MPKRLANSLPLLRLASGGLGWQEFRRVPSPDGRATIVFSRQPMLDDTCFAADLIDDSGCHPFIPCTKGDAARLHVEWERPGQRSP